MKYSEAGEFMRKVWGSRGNNQLHEKQFMDAMRSIMFWFATEEENGLKPMENSYDSTSVLDSISRAISSFNEVYHKTDVSLSWNKTDDEEE